MTDLRYVSGSDPNLLFSLPPFIEDCRGIPCIILSPSEEDDSPRMQAAVNRLNSIGGGIMRLSAGDHYLAEPFYVGDEIRFG